MLVVVAVVVVDVRGYYSLAHRFERGGNSAFNICVAGVEAETQIVQVRFFYEILQRQRRAYFVWRVFQGDRHASLLGENGQMLQGIESGVDESWIGGLPAAAHVLDEIFERDALGDVDGALYFVDC